MHDYGARGYGASIGRFTSVDPLADAPANIGHSPYSYVWNNPLRFVDPDGRHGEDFVQRQDGSKYWDNNAKCKSTTKANETYLGENLTFTFISYIDEKTWDGPLLDWPAGEKLISTITFKSTQNEKGELLYMEVKSNFDVEYTFGWVPGSSTYDEGIFGEGGKDYGLTNKAIDVSGYTKFRLEGDFEQHAEVFWSEEIGLNMLGYQTVNIAQTFSFSLKNNELRINAGTGLFPSATLDVNDHILFQYDAPSFSENYRKSRLTDHYLIYERFRN